MQSGSGGRGRIRTDERRSGRIYSPHPLATWIPYLKRKMYYESAGQTGKTIVAYNQIYILACSNLLQQFYLIECVLLQEKP